MGGDLILAIAVMPDIPEHELDIDAYKNAYLEAINKLSDAQAMDLYVELHGEGPEEDGDENPTRTQQWLPYEVVRQSFRDLVDILSDEPRDCGYYKVGNRWSFITGGVSWGDSPSDSFDDVNILSSIWWAVHGE